MSEPIKENDNFTLYIAVIAILFISALLVVKSNEDDKFAPIKAQVEEELKLMNVRVLENKKGENT